MVHLTEADLAQPTASVAHQSIIKNEFAHSVITKNSIWINDTGASHHMTKDSDNLTCHKPSLRTTICTANGSTSPITGEGSLVLNDAIILDIVLVVPSLAYNLCRLVKSQLPLSAR